MPCSPNDIFIDIPDGPSGPAIPNFGTPFSLKVPDIGFKTTGFPEDILDYFNKLFMYLPPGKLQVPGNFKFEKDAFDYIMKLLDKFLPYLMMYKFFLPLLKMILCVIEVLCALKNPFKVVKALKKLFRKCIPDFLNLFPIFALLVMIISLANLLYALIKYLYEQIKNIYELIKRNLRALDNARKIANDTSILAIAEKIGATLCIFQNLFVLLSIFAIIFDIIRDILSLVFTIPPCDNSDETDLDGCCTVDVCPQIIKEQYTNKTGKFYYYNTVSKSPAPPNNFLTLIQRSQAWQFYDEKQITQQAFINIADPYDVTAQPGESKPVFFPTDATYTSQTAAKQAAYTVDIKLLYDPAVFNRTNSSDGLKRYISFKDCIIQYQPTRQLNKYDNSQQFVPTGTILLIGGKGYEEDGSVLNGYDESGVVKIDAQATLENFIHTREQTYVDPNPVQYNQPIIFEDVEYTFKPNHAALVGKDLVTAGCLPTFRGDADLVGADSLAAAAKAKELSDLMMAPTTFNNDEKNQIEKNVRDHYRRKNKTITPEIDKQIKDALSNLNKQPGFPDPAKTQEQLFAAANNLRGNLTFAGLDEFEKACNAALDVLLADTINSQIKIITLGIDVSRSTFTIIPNKQFTSRTIEVQVNLKDRYSNPLTVGLPVEVSSSLATKLKGIVGFGKINNFSYDGYQYFKANISSTSPGDGNIQVSFDNEMFYSEKIPTNSTDPIERTIQSLPYSFIYTPSIDSGASMSGQGVPLTSTNTTDNEAVDAAKLAEQNKQNSINNAASNIIYQIDQSTESTSVSTTTQPRRDESENYLADGKGENKGNS